MSSTNFTTTSLASFIPELWADSISKYFESKLIFKPLVEDYSALVSKFGDTINVPTIAELSASSKTAGVDNKLSWTDASNEGQETITINQHKYVGRLFEDIAVVQSREELFGKYAKHMGYALAKAVDVYIENLLRGLSTTQGLTTDNTITNAEIETALATLGEADIDYTSGDVFFAVNPTLYADLLANDRFIRYDAIGGGVTPITSGLVGHIYGMPVLMSNIITSAGAATDEAGYMFHRSAVGLAIQKGIRVQEQYDVDYLGTKVVADIIFGASLFQTASEARGIAFTNAA